MSEKDPSDFLLKVLLAIAGLITAGSTFVLAILQLAGG